MSSASNIPLFPPDPAETATAAQRLQAQIARIERAARAVGRDPAAIDLVAVGKHHPVTALAALYAAGQRRFGENYAQELASKAALLAAQPDISFAFVGTIQSNKLKQIVANAAEAQTVTSLDQAGKIARLALELNKRDFSIWLAVNAGGEKTKSGLAVDDAQALAHAVARDFPQLSIAGLMAIPPPLTDSELAAPDPPRLYLDLARVATSIGKGGLSLGMTDDLEHAVKAGSTTVRIGTALFGPRPVLLA